MDEERFITYCHQFAKAVERLREALEAPYSDFVRDAAVQRFEFCWELGWKLGKVWLISQGLEVSTPRASWEGLLQAGVLQDGNSWSHLQRLRNLTSHTHDEALAQQVYDYLRKQGIGAFTAFAGHAKTWAALADR